uniref:BBP1_C domain-containing protein n=1 Tax=Strongyloides venezuelensis TaxID=75913 RepID=A0A0K0FCF4_STRVS
MHECDMDHNLNLSHHSSLYEINTIENTQSTLGTEDETSQTKHEIFLLKQLLKMQNDMMCEYEKSIENLSRNSPRSSSGSIDSECYLELEKKIEQLRDENKRLVLECRRNTTTTVNDFENEKIYISRDVYEDLVVERKHLKSQYDVYKELFESSEAHVFNLEDTIENMKVENKQLLNEVGRCNFLIEKLKDDNNTCKVEFEDLMKQLRKKKDEEVNYYKGKIEKLLEEKRQLLEDVESLTSTVEIIKGQKNDTTKESPNNQNYLEIINNMTKLIDDLEEKLLFYINYYQQVEVSQAFDKEIIIYKDNDKIFFDSNVVKYQQQPPPPTPNMNVKSLGEEIEEIQIKETYNYNILSSSQQSTLVESFIYLAICLLVYEFYLFILYIFKQ